MNGSSGEYLVGVSFNPSGLPEVDKIKRLAADLINAIEDIKEPIDENFFQAAEVMHAKYQAQTCVENAAMWAVKAATKPAPGA